MLETLATAADAGSEINVRIAARVKSLRRERGMSLARLAQASGVSRSMISVIERAEASPTAVVLEKIAAGMGLPLASLFDDPHGPPSPVSRGSDRSVWRDPQSGYERCNISPPGVSSPIRITHVTLPSGAGVAYETTARPADIHEQIWVTEGSIEVTVGDASYRLTKDDCLAFRLDKPTAFRNPGRKRARYIVVIAEGSAP